MQGQHRTIPALRLKHRSGSCGTASAAPRSPYRHLELCGIALSFLSTEITGGFTGCTVGMYASANGIAGTNHAAFYWFAYQQV